MQKHHADQMQATNHFMERLGVLVSSIQVRKDEAAKGTRHGLEFEVSVGDAIKSLVSEAGDVVQDSGSTTGLINHCKVGDFVVTLGPENVAAGARIVVEAKESAAYDLAKSLAEADTARRNRGAGVCVFVHSQKTAQQGIPEFARYGHDIVVRWDAEEQTSDLWLKAALMVAKMMSVRAAQHDKSEAASYQIVDRAIESIRKQVTGFDDIVTAATTSGNAARKIVERATLMKAEIEAKINALGEQVVKLKATASKSD